MADGMSKEKWNEMNLKQKLEYFINYYLKYVIIGGVAIALGISMIVSIVTPSTTAISGQLLNISIMKEGFDQYLCDDFLATGDFGKKASAVAQLGVYTRDLDASYQTSLAMDIRMEAKELDYFLVDSEGLEVLNEGGMLLDLSAILDDSMKEELKDRLVELDNLDETVTGKYIGAIDVTDSKFVNEFTDKNGKYYFAVAVTSERTENVVKMIKYLLESNN